MNNFFFFFPGECEHFFSVGNDFLVNREKYLELFSFDETSKFSLRKEKYKGIIETEKKSKFFSYLSSSKISLLFRYNLLRCGVMKSSHQISHNEAHVAEAREVRRDVALGDGRPRLAANLTDPLRRRRRVRILEQSDDD